MWAYLLLSGHSMHSHTKHTLACEAIEAELREMRQKCSPAQLTQRAKAISLSVGVLHDRHDRHTVCICTITPRPFNCMCVSIPNNRHIRCGGWPRWHPATATAHGRRISGVSVCACHRRLFIASFLLSVLLSIVYILHTQPRCRAIQAVPAPPVVVLVGRGRKHPGLGPLLPPSLPRLLHVAPAPRTPKRLQQPHPSWRIPSCVAHHSRG